jgi:hypothetical protein
MVVHIKVLVTACFLLRICAHTYACTRTSSTSPLFPTFPSLLVYYQISLTLPMESEASESQTSETSDTHFFSCSLTYPDTHAHAHMHMSMRARAHAHTDTTRLYWNLFRI